MNKVKRNNTFILLGLSLVLALAPAFAFADPTTSTPQQQGGILSCNQQGAYAMSVGALAATAGVFVPVSDAVVELNTGTLVYKECVLREVIDAERQAATAGIIQTGTTYILTGRNGSPQFVQQQGQELAQVGNAAVQAYLQNDLSSLDPSIQSQVAQAIAQGYAVTINNAPSMLACPYSGATAAFTNASAQFSWNNILAIGSPCNPIFGYIAANDLTNGYAAQEQNCQLKQWQWGGGFYAVTSGSGGPCEQQILTPSSQVNGLYSQLLQSPFSQLQSANDIGQMVGGLFAGISTAVLSPNYGISGLNQPIGGSPSYLQQAVGQEAQNLQSNLQNAGSANVSSALQTEQQYYNTMQQIAGTLTSAIAQLRGSENQCWQQITQALCPSGVSSNGNCTDVNGVQLKVSTSTEFSQAVINSQIATLASTTVNNLTVSGNTVTQLEQLSQGVSSGSSAAIQQLDQLVASNQLHTPADITTAQTQEQSVQSAMTTLTQNTPSLWAGTDPNNTSDNNIPWNGTVGATIQSTDPGVGWCNFQNKPTLSLWEQAWKI